MQCGRGGSEVFQRSSTLLRSPGQVRSGSWTRLVLGAACSGWWKNSVRLCGKDRGKMRTPNVTLIHETVSLCFDQVLTTIGEITKRMTYDFLKRKGVGPAGSAEQVRGRGESSCLTLWSRSAFRCAWN